MDARSRPILLVDDNSADAELTVWAFTKNGITNPVIVARDGVEALELLHPGDGRRGLEPAIVLMDINMPRMDGLETLREIRAHPATRTLPVIMLTASIVDQDILDSCDGGANSYVQKPVDADSFLTVARQLGLYWLDVHRQATNPDRPTTPTVPASSTTPLSSAGSASAVAETEGRDGVAGCGRR